MLPLLYITAFGLVSLGLGWPMVARLDQGALSGVERASAAFALGTVALYLLVFAGGRVSLAPGPMWGLSAVCVLAALPGLWAIPWHSAAAALRAHMARLRHDPLEALLLGALVVTLLAALIQGMAPPNDYDSLMYHLAVPRLDVERGVIAPAWQRTLPHGFFPQLTGNLYRLVLATAGEAPVQMVTGLFGVAAAASTAALACRVGCGRRTMLLAALAFAGSRVVVWEMASAEVEVALALFTALAMILLLAWRERDGTGLVVLLGLMLGGGILVKFHGAVIAIAVGLPLLATAIRRPARLVPLILAAVAGLALLLPHGIEAYALTGNPLFPMLNQLFTPGGVDYFGDLRGQYGIGRDLWALVVTPWTLSVTPMQHFDGMVLGAPYFLILAPLAALARPRPDRGLALLTVAGAYYVVWFYLLSQQVRFLLPIFPILATWSASGAAALLHLSRHGLLLRAGVVAVLGVLMMNQSLFVGIYAALRLPPALGLMSAEAYHGRTPTLTGAFYLTCRWLERAMAVDETVMSLLVPHSYYCPQRAAITRTFPDEERSWVRTGQPPAMAREEFVRRFAAANIRWVIVPVAHESRRNDTGEARTVAINLAQDRFGQHLAPVLAALTPVVAEPYSAVYDGRDVLAALQAGR